MHKMHNGMFPQALFQCCNNVDCLHLNDVKNIGFILFLRLILIRPRFLTLDVAYVENLLFFLRLYDPYATGEANINAIAYCTRVTLLIDEN